MPKVSICVLIYGDYPELAIRAIESIRRHCSRVQYELVVGANAAGVRTLRYLKALHTDGEIDHLILSEVNLNQCPMMRRMFATVRTEFIWWFDDDSFITDPGALEEWLGHTERAEKRTVMWGPLAVCNHPVAFAPDMKDVIAFVRTAKWYRGLPPPSWKLGGKGEFDYAGLGTGDGNWLFVPGGCWLVRTSAVRALDWPDRRLMKMGNDVFLGEAIRQQGWKIQNIGSPGVAINTEPRRGDPGLLPQERFS
jgi:GT2 family glycosyltransferase